MSDAELDLSITRAEREVLVQAEHWYLNGRTRPLEIAMRHLHIARENKVKYGVSDE